MIDFEAINRTALSALPAILRRILPDGKIVAREYVALNPTRADRRPGSFKINLRTGHWADFATGDKGGDPVSLCAYIEGVSQGEAARRLARMLGFETGGRLNG
jgi:DNA primase